MMAATVQDNQKHCAPIRIAAVEHRCKTALLLGTTDKGGGLNPRGKSRVQVQLR